MSYYLHNIFFFKSNLAFSSIDFYRVDIDTDTGYILCYMYTMYTTYRKIPGKEGNGAFDQELPNAQKFSLASSKKDILHLSFL